jgi:hypothetical protein
MLGYLEKDSFLLLQLLLSFLCAASVLRLILGLLLLFELIGTLGCLA